MSTLKELVELANMDINQAASYDIGSDDGALAKEIYSNLFDFYDKENFSGDVSFTWKSPSLVENGDYVGHRKSKVDNSRVIGNIFPNYKSNRKYSLNLNRNGEMGDFPHDFFDIYLDHVAKYAFKQNRPQIMEYYPLKRAILYEKNKEYFDIFFDYDDFIKRNYFQNIVNYLKQNHSFLDMDFEEYKKETSKLIHDRGVIMLEVLKEKYGEAEKK